MGPTTAIVLVALIIAFMVVGVIALIVFGGVRALEVRRSGAPRGGEVRPYTRAVAAPQADPAPGPGGHVQVAHHPMFDEEHRR